jgi:hypothetical protein
LTGRTPGGACDTASWLFRPAIQAFSFVRLLTTIPW